LTNYIAKIMGIKRFFTLPIKKVQLVHTWYFSQYVCTAAAWERRRLWATM
jgi:hypothetical protein